MNERKAVMLCFAFASSLIAASGSIEYKIRDSLTHHPIKTATIKLIPQSIGTPITATADQKGHGRIIGIPPGEYGVEISAPGYKPMTSHDTIISSNGKIQDGGVVDLDSETVPEAEQDDVVAKLHRTGYTLIHEYVSDADTGEPIPGVKVRTVKGKAEATTDADGHLYLSTPTPAPTYDYQIVGTDTFIYEKPGYKTLIFRNVIVSDDMGGGSAIDMQKGSGVQDIDDTHKLMRDDGPPAQPTKHPKD